jgi:hypothetical protein
MTLPHIMSLSIKLTHTLLLRKKRTIATSEMGEAAIMRAAVAAVATAAAAAASEPVHKGG